MSALPMSAVLDQIEEGVWDVEVQRVRASTVKSERQALKKKVPAFTGSGVFSKRNKDSLTTHSGYIIIDLDDIDPVKVKMMISGRRDPFVRAAFTSVSGSGVAVVFRIDPKRHAESFVAICDYLRTEYKIEEIDVACKDVSRLRFVSSDDHMYQNHDAEEFPLTESDAKIAVSRPSRGLIAPTPVASEYTPERILHIIKTNMRNATEGMRHAFRLRNARLAGGFVAGGMVGGDEVRDLMIRELTDRGVEGAELVEEIKTIDDGIAYGAQTPITIDTVVEHMTETAASQEKMRSLYRDVFHMLREGNENPMELADTLAEKLELDIDDVKSVIEKVYTENEDQLGFNDLPAIHKMHRFLTSKYDFLRNIVTGSVVHRMKGSEGRWREVNEDGLFIELRMMGTNIQMGLLTSWLASPEIAEIDPFVEYFKGLQAYPEGVGSVIEGLAKYITTGDPDFFASMLKKALVRQIKCVLEDEYVNRIVVVLMSDKQGTGKSTFIRWLSPFTGGQYYREDAMSFDKDTSIAMSETMIYNLDELSVLSKSSITTLKAWISKSRISERRPYARKATRLPRRCTFWGSTNDDDFLTDRENTRWLVFEVKDMNFGYKADFDIDTIYSEAYHLYKEGFDCELSADEKLKQADRNEGFGGVSFEEAALLSMFRPIDDESEGAWYSMADIRDQVSSTEHGTRNINAYAFTQAVSKLKYKRTRKKVNGVVTRGIIAHRVMSATAEDINDSTRF